MSLLIQPKAGFKGYYSDAANASAEYLSTPSSNCIVTSDGRAESRKGYSAEFSIGVSNKNATCFYHQTYDVAFFALGTKVYYRDFNTSTTVDTGITLTTGTKTRFSEFNNDVYLTNTTDGVQRIVVGRLNDAAANSGDGAVTVDVDFASRLSVFGIGATGSIRINGDSYAYNATDVATGVITLNAVTLSSTYADNSIVIRVHDISGTSGIQKPSKIEFWKSRLHSMGFPSATDFDAPNHSVNAGQFVIGQTGATGIESIIDFTWGTGGATKIQVNGGGAVTNILGAKDFFWFFAKRKVYATSSADITTSGSAIGLTIPDEKDELHGCLNEDCATVMGDNAITWIDHKKFMRIPISTDTGAPVSPPQEDFDAAIREDLINMDSDQTGALVYHYRGGLQTIYQVKISGLWTWFIYDHNIVFNTSSGVQHGAWQPPQLINPVTGFFEREGVLFGTDMTTDTVYSFFTAFSDNQTAIQTTIATGEFNVGNAMMKRATLQGDINFPSEINIRCYVTNNTSGRRSGRPKIVLGSNYSYDGNLSIGAVPIGSGGVTSETTEIARWKKEFYIFPSEANTAQLIAENFQDGGYFSISSYSLSGDQLAGTFAASL